VKTVTVTRTRTNLGKAPAPLACALNGHLFRAVMQGRTPIELECVRCPARWDVTPAAPTDQARPEADDLEPAKETTGG